MARFDWPALVRAGLHDLQLRPAEFWALTPAEFAVKLGHRPGDAPMDRGRLAALMARFPDAKKGHDHGR